MQERGDTGLFGRTGLLLPAVAAPMVEAGLLRAFDPGSAALAAQVTAPAPLDLFHDMRWISVFHNSWVVFAAELVAVLILRSVWAAWIVQRSWPGPTPPGMLPASRRASLFYALSMILFVQIGRAHV